MSTQWEGRVRTSDAEREQVVAILRAAVSEGRLTLQEGDERMAQAYEARYREQLAPLTADLPGKGWEALARTPEAIDALRRRLRVHGAGVALAAGLLIGAWLLSGAHFFWPLLPLAFLAFGLARHARFVRHGGRWGWGPGAPWGRGPWGRGPWDEAARGPR
jgi:hypothetical protein